MKEMKIYLIRHGQTDWNKIKRLQGSVDISLNEDGRELARLTAKGLADVNFDVIYTSPLDRAKETALIIKGSRDIPVIEDNRIKEMCFGKYEGCLAKEDPKIWILFEHPEQYIAPEDGESLEELCDRCGSFLRDIISDNRLQDKTILISTHGAALNALLKAVKKVPMSDFWGNGVQKNCAVTIIEAEKGSTRIVEEARTYY